MTEFRLAFYNIPDCPALPASEEDAAPHNRLDHRMGKVAYKLVSAGTVTIGEDDVSGLGFDGFDLIAHGSMSF
jgi:hypothetical protein